MLREEFTISDLVFPELDPPTYETALEGYSVSLVVSGDISTLQGSRAYIAFDKTFDTFGGFSKENGYSYSMNFFGSDSGTANQQYLVSDQLCMDGTFQSAPYLLNVPLNYRTSVCGGYLFGVDTNGSSRSLRDGLFLVSVPTGGRGIASLFDFLRHEGWISYIDPVTRRMTIRRGSLDYKEYPVKSEIAYGKYESVASVVDGDIMILDDTKERLRRLSFTVPDATSNGDYLAFSVGDTVDNSYGFIISGDGLLNLQAFAKFYDLPPSSFPPDLFTTTDGQIVSPVYVYKKGEAKPSSSIDVDIAADIINGEDRINILNGAVSNVKAQYIKDNQTMTDPGLYDMIQLSDGEVLLIYGADYASMDFTVNGQKNSSSDWITKKAVMMLGTPNDDFYWGTPLKKRFSDDETVRGWQYPLMVMNNAEYYSSIYDSLNDTVMIFVRVISEGIPHIAGYY